VASSADKEVLPSRDKPRRTPALTLQLHHSQSLTTLQLCAPGLARLLPLLVLLSFLVLSLLLQLLKAVKDELPYD
jgi:hypothetical protein